MIQHIFSRFMFARIVVIQLLNQKCIIYISRTITLTVLHSSNFMTKDISNSLTLILQVCYFKLIRLELEISFYQFNFCNTETYWNSLSLSLSLHILLFYIRMGMIILFPWMQVYMLMERMASNRCNILLY